MPDFKTTMSPRRQSSRSSRSSHPSLADKISNGNPNSGTTTADSSLQGINQSKGHKEAAMDLSSVVDNLTGGNPALADVFFGMPQNETRPLLPVPGEEDRDGDTDEVLTAGDGSSTAPPATDTPENQEKACPETPQHTYTITIGNEAHQRIIPQPTFATEGSNPDYTASLDDITLRQLRADVAAYQVDRDFCMALLDERNRDRLSPAEFNTFVARLMDVGHKIRECNNKIELIETGRHQSQSALAAGSIGITAVNFAIGGISYSTGSILRAAAAAGNSLPSAGGYQSQQQGEYQGQQQGGYQAQQRAGYQGQFGPNPPGWAMNSFNQGNNYPGSERRKPGRPAGSKNRVVVPDPAQSSEFNVASSPGAGNDMTDVAQATTSAPTTAHRGGSSSEIHVALEGEPSAKLAGKRKSHALEDDSVVKAEKRHKKGDVNMQIDGEHAENEITAAAGQGSHSQDGESMYNRPTNAGPSNAHPSAQAFHTPPTGGAFRAFGPAPQPNPSHSAGPHDAYQRHGYWRCRLCTSQKYLNAPMPKKPSEPGQWPLCDVSKMVTHYTRMHSEHNNVERCMELGAALRDNRGPLRFWLIQTKKEKMDVATVDATIEELENGRMPSLLRRVSKAANEFPGT